MIVSKNPREDVAIKAAAAFMVTLMLAFLALVTCQASRPEANWRGPFAMFTASERLILIDHFSRVERHRAQSHTSDPR